MRSSFLALILIIISRAAFGQSEYLSPVELPFAGNGALGDIGDIDGDGDNDIAFSTGPDRRLFVLYNDNGEFTRLESIAVAGAIGMMPVTIHDMNADGVDDIVVATSAKKVSIYSYDDGKMKEVTSISFSSISLNAMQIHCADLNNDNKSDIIVSYLTEGNFVWELESQEDGSFLEKKITTEINVRRSRLADIDMDGSIDLVVSDYSGTSISINKNVDGEFTADQKTFAYGSALEFIVSEFNGDGRPDIAVLDISGYLEYFEQTETGTFPRKWKIETGGGAGLLATDVDNDGDQDLVISPSLSAPIVKIFTNDGAAVFSEGETIKLGEHTATIIGGDVDGDNIPELLPLGRASHIELFKRDAGMYRSYTNFIFASNPSGKGQLADMNKDGKPDLVLLHTEAKAISVALGTGDEQIFGDPVYFRTGEFFFPSQVEIGDFNNDSFPDAMYVCLETVAQSSPGGIIYGSAEGEFDHVMYDARTNVNSWRLHVADFDNDGNDDFLSGSVFLNNGDGSFTEQVVLNANIIDGATVGDFNNDGNVDMAFATPAVTSVQMNTGGAVFEVGFQFDSPNIDVGTISSADVNGDEFDDLIYYDTNLKQLVVMLSHGNGNFLKKTIDYPLISIAPLYFVSDQDEDGIPELVIFKKQKLVAYHVAFDTAPAQTQTFDESLVGLPYKMLPGSINADEIPDIVFIGYNYPSNVVLSRILVEPTIPPSSIIVSDITLNSAKLSFTPGNGNGRIVIIKEGEPVTGVPVDKKFYTANSVMDSGTDLGAGNYVVFAGDGTSVTVTNLKVKTTYYYSLYESNRTDFRIDYLASQSVTGSFETDSIHPPKVSQTISFEVPTKTAGDPDFILDGEASSGLPLTYQVLGGEVTISGDTVTIDNPGYAIIRASQPGNAEFEPAFLDVEFCINPEKPIITPGTDNGQNFVIISNTEFDDASNWYLDGASIEDVYTKEIVPAAEGTYITTTTVGRCTSDFSDPFTYVGLNENSSVITIYPSPAKGQLFVTMDDVGIQPTVMDITGRTYRLETFIHPGSVELNVAHLATGLYILKIHNGVSFKFLKE